MMPAVLAVAPFALTAKVIDDNSPQRSNTDFIFAGQIVNDQNQPVDSVEAHVTRWIATHRHEGFADRWEQRTETHALNSQFTLDVKNAQALDIVLRYPGYLDQHVIFNYGVVRPPFIHINFDTYRRWNNREPTAPIDSANLEGGGTFYEGYPDARPVKKEDLHIVMQRHASETSIPASTK